MSKVNYMCIGTQKAGTSSLPEYLNLHPDVSMKGEMHFFDKPRDQPLNEEMTVRYEQALASEKRLRGEKTPSYMYLRHAMDRIAAYNPDMKLIVILREPVARAYSQYNFDKACGFIRSITWSFWRDLSRIVPLEKIDANGPHRIVRGFYDQQLEYIFQRFPRENVHIAVSEEVRNDKQKEYGKIFDFLGVDASSVKIDRALDKNIGVYKSPIPAYMERKLERIYAPHVERLYDILGYKIGAWERYG
ncbi:MAG: sulfotransferase [Xanthomonadales bacterium]|nr:sulfotransferase [Xanthomonadales bacterium]